MKPIIQKSTEIRRRFFQRGFVLTFSLHGIRRCYFLDANRSITIGRSSKANIVIPLNGVAPLHCKIDFTTKGELLLLSEDNNFPTLIDGIPADFKILSPGDNLKIGPLSLKICSHITLKTNSVLTDHEIGYENEFGFFFLKSLKQAHWIMASIAFHLCIILLISKMTKIEGSKNDLQKHILSQFHEELQSTVDLDDEAVLKNYRNIVETLIPPPRLPSHERITDMTEVSMEEQIYGQSEIYTSLGKQGSISGLTLPLLLRMRNTSSQVNNDMESWKEHVKRLRIKGMDIAIIFDSTGSMESFIIEVKSTIQEMVCVLQSIVPDITMSLITYKGDPKSSDYVVAHTPLVKEAYELLNFLRSVKISGGSAEGYAAIYSALKTSIDVLEWRKGTNKIIVVIGDAPPFPDEKKKCYSLLDRFNGKVATLYKPSYGTTLLLEPETTAVLKKLSNLGNGPYLRLGEEENAARTILCAVLGTEWEEQINNAFNMKMTEPMRKILDRKQKSIDLNWFLEQFKEQKVRFEVVDRLMEMDEERVAIEMVYILKLPEIEAELTQKALFVLQNMTGIEFNYMNTPRDRLTSANIRYITEYLKFLYGPEILKRMEKR